MFYDKFVTADFLFIGLHRLENKFHVMISIHSDVCFTFAHLLISKLRRLMIFSFEEWCAAAKAFKNLSYVIFYQFIFCRQR